MRRKARRSSSAVPTALLLALLAGGAVSFYLMQRGAEIRPPERTALAPEFPTTAVLARPLETADGEPEASDLAELDESDALVRALIGRASPGLELARWLASPNLIRRFTVSVDNIAEGKSPRRHLSELAPMAPFRAIGKRDAFYVDPRSYERYDLMARVFSLLSAPACARVYRSIRPLIDEAYRDLGYPGRDFDDTLGRAISELLETPVVEGSPELTQGLISYRYRDPALETLSAVQKQLLRMGPRNARKVQDKLREIGAALDIAT